MMPSPPKRRQPLVQSRPVHHHRGRGRLSIRFTVSVSLAPWASKFSEKPSKTCLPVLREILTSRAIVDVVIIITMDGMYLAVHLSVCFRWCTGNGTLFAVEFVLL